MSRITNAVEIVIVEGITQGYAFTLVGPQLLKELRRLEHEEKTFDLTRLDRSIVRYRNLKPSSIPQDPAGNFAYVINQQAEAIACYQLPGL